MPELNPYEPPQTEIKPTSSVEPRASAKDSIMPHWIVPNLIGLQILTGVLAFILEYLQAMDSPGRGFFQAAARFSATSFLGLGFVLWIIALRGRSFTLLIVESLILLIIFLFVLWMGLMLAAGH